MLTLLTIKDFGLITTERITLGAGMTVLTGETGAGKSVVLAALALIVGQRADPRLIREGAAQCEVAASFDIRSLPKVKQLLSQQNLGDGGDDLVVTRILNRGGRSKALINGIVCPLQVLTRLGELLLHMHGQHAQHHLQQSEQQRQQLDAFAQHHELQAKVASAFYDLQRCQSIYQRLQQRTSPEQRQQLLTYQLQELQALALQPDTLSIMHQSHQQLAQADHTLQTLAQVLNLLDGDPQSGVYQRLSQLEQMLSRLPVVGMQAVIELIATAQTCVSEAMRELLQIQSTVRDDPEELQRLEFRLQQVHDVARKHQVQAEGLWDHQQALEQQLQACEGDAQAVSDAHQAVVSAQQRYQECAAALSASRKVAIAGFEQALNDRIPSLGMPHGKLQVVLSHTDQPSAAGMDKVVFMVSLNPGTGFKPLAQTASGGELSRLSLAIQWVTATAQIVPIVVFDEIDAGLGGAVAAQVGAVLHCLGQNAQVICVTHQAQVAAQANAHIRIEKTIVDSRAMSFIQHLQQSDRIAELARMMSGVAVTAETLAHAKVLLETG